MKPYKRAASKPQLSKLTRFRVGLDVSQSELAAILGVTQTTVSKVERGLRAPSLPLAMAYDRWSRSAARRGRVAAEDRPTLVDLEAIAVGLEGTRIGE